MIQYLTENTNEYNNFVLSLVKRDDKISNKEIFLPGPISKHHVLPIHAQGSPEKWNIIQVTKKEHMVLHKLRFQVYKEEGDKKAIFGTTSDFVRYDSSSFQNQINEEIKEKKRNIPNWGVLRRTPEVSLAIQKGMVWVHNDGYEIIIFPNSVETVRQIVDKLIESLPEEHVDRIRMSSNENSANFIRNHIHTVFHIETTLLNKRQFSAYGFEVQPLFEEYIQ